MKIQVLAASMMLAAIFPFTASADQIVSVGGDLVEVVRPAALSYGYSVGVGVQYSGVINPNPIIFNEYTNFAIPTFSALSPSDPVFALVGGISPSTFIGLDFMNVDITAPGTYPPSVGGNYSLSSGTRVTSYIVNYEPSDTNPIGSAVGSVTFDSDVIAIQSNFGTGYGRTLLFESPGNSLSNISLVGSTGLELCNSDPTTCDQITLSSDRRTVSFSTNVNGATDDFRIFVAPTPVPEPLTFSLFGSGLAGMIAMRRRKNVPYKRLASRRWRA